jgi:hypothetical protein
VPTADPRRSGQVETRASTRYTSRMAKRLQVNFHRPGPTFIPEEGQPRPCARGVGWVHEATLQTLEKLDIPRTDAKGRALPPGSQEPNDGR